MNSTVFRLLGAGLFSIFVADSTFAQTEDWVRRHYVPGSFADQPYAIAVDGSNNVVVTGVCAADYETIKYSAAGVVLWTNRYDNFSSDTAYAVAIDRSNNVFVTGISDLDYATIKYSAAGALLWTNTYDGPGNVEDGARAVAVDGDGNVVVTGHSASTNQAPYNFDYATIKYSSAGTVLWARRYNGPADNADRAIAVAVDSSNNVVVTGFSADINGFPHYATIMYSATGVPLWTNRLDQNSSDVASAVVIDGSNNVVVTGTSIGELGGFDYATIAYSSAGVPLWTNRYDGPAGDDWAYAVAVDGTGNVFVTGDSDGGGGDTDYATIKYSAAGVPLWTNRYDGPPSSDDSARAMAVDNTGNVIVTGRSIGSGGNYDYATVAYSGAGVPLWTNRYDGGGGISGDFATAVAVDGNGDVVVTGFSYDSTTRFDYVTVKYSSAGVPLLTITRTTTNTVAVSWPSPSTGFILQQNTNGIGSGQWSNVLTTPLDDLTNKTFVVDPPLGNRFYRLCKP